MTTTNNHRFGYIVAALIVAVIAVYLFRGCEKEKQAAEPKPAEQARTRYINTDSLRSAIESQYRTRETKLIQAHSAELAQIKARLPKSKDKATASVKTYQTAPNLANCDTAIANLQSHVSELETGLSISDSIMKGQANVIGSFAQTVQRKDSVIGQLNAGWQAANLENAKLEKKVRNRNKLLKLLGGAVAVLVGVVAVK